MVFYSIRAEHDYNVRRNQEMEEKRTQSWVGRPKATTIAEDNFIKVTSLRDRSLIASNTTAILVSWEKCVNILSEKTGELAYMAELLSKNHC